MVKIYVNRCKAGLESGKYATIEDALADVPTKWREAVQAALEG
jgi:hypothetical protein